MAVDHDKLRKFVGMLGSDHEGEQLNALRFIKKMAADEKKTITELLLSGGERIVEKVVYRDAPQQQPYRRNYSGSSFYEEPRQKKHSSGFSGGDGGIESREILEALKQAGEEGRTILSQHELDFARSIPYEYSYDYELSSKQVRYARSIIARYRRGTEDAVI